MKLDNKQINEIAQSLDVGMTCYVNKKTAAIKELPSQEMMDYDDIGSWEEDIQEVEQNLDNYIKIEKPSSREGFQFMERFVEKIPDVRIQNKLIEALNKSRPFRNFKNVVDYYEPIRQAWFKHKNEEYEAYVRRELRGELEE